MPPLKERREDIPLLANHFLKKYAGRAKKSIKEISADALRLLMQYDFPGNVRELENIIQSAVVLETTEQLQPNNLPPQILSMIPFQSILSLPDSAEILPLEEVERQILAHALKVMDNDVTRAAQALKIDRSTLYRKVKLYQLARIQLSSQNVGLNPICHDEKGKDRKMDSSRFLVTACCASDLFAFLSVAKCDIQSHFANHAL